MRSRKLANRRARPRLREANCWEPGAVYCHAVPLGTLEKAGVSRLVTVRKPAPDEIEAGSEQRMLERIDMHCRDAIARDKEPEKDASKVAELDREVRTAEGSIG